MSERVIMRYLIWSGNNMKWLHELRKRACRKSRITIIAISVKLRKWPWKLSKW
ncbi:hypothetical protein HanRHA438_Chr08g0369501 [Helianthus annuus]|uniref:Uncharacterized protein n=1 Tax=Helianthus annuus TaxID=4232 RepID=A0A9K3II46_HELAN|nr:hypothetical protein HanXRQr2_Chr08g0357411 [Helianthus annuus]KAJ0899521.1 hypothetical protein HanRHA438_Chr08g0369501 [Helianthus annuus]KAJ0903099.1 hypothetical protein HanPSC8_Chr08g0345081 [Helianthus annuus]